MGRPGETRCNSNRGVTGGGRGRGVSGSAGGREDRGTGGGDTCPRPCHTLASPSVRQGEGRGGRWVEASEQPHAPECRRSRPGGRADLRVLPRTGEVHARAQGGAGCSRLPWGRGSKHMRQGDGKAERVAEREGLGDPFHESGDGRCTRGPIGTPLVTPVSSACQTGGRTRSADGGTSRRQGSRF